MLPGNHSGARAERRGRSAPPPQRVATPRSAGWQTRKPFKSQKIAPVLRVIAQHVPVVDAMDIIRLDGKAITKFESIPALPAERTGTALIQKKKRSNRPKWNP